MRSPLIGRLREAALVVALLFATPLASEPLDLTLEQARYIAKEAFSAGEYALSKALALRLLEANPKDAQALLVLAATEPKLGNPTAGRIAGRMAWAAAAKMPALRYEIARYTAAAAFQEGRPTMAQFWLRRAADAAPTADSYRQTTEDFAELRARNPLRFGIDLVVTPTSNLNRGAKTGLLIIDDSLVVGPLSGSSMALSGVRTVAQARISYALPARARSQSTVGLRFFGSLNSFSAEAKRLAPDLSASDLNQYAAEVSFNHDFLLPNSRRPISLGLAAGQSFSNDGPLGPHIRIDAGLPLVMGQTASVQIRSTYETQWQSGGAVNAASVTLAGSRQNRSGGRLGWSVSVNDIDGRKVNQTYRSVMGDISYALGKPVGPVMLSAKLSAGLSDYPNYMLGLWSVTKGRQDQEIALSVDMIFADYGLWGYAPKLSLTAQQTRSNISRFDTVELGLTLGFESKF